MPQTGVEPAHGNPYSDLNAARLPIPPLGQVLFLFYQKYSKIKEETRKLC